MLDEISAYCSILGFVISLLTLLYAFFIERKLQKFERNVFFNTRVTTLINSLKILNSNLSRSLQSGDKRKIKEIIHSSKTLLEDIVTKVPKDLRKQAIQTKKRLNKQYRSYIKLAVNDTPTKWKFFQSITNIDNLWESYDDLNAFTSRVDNLTRDREITR